MPIRGGEIDDFAQLDRPAAGLLTAAAGWTLPARADADAKSAVPPLG
jgi:hypothetical protein